MSLFPAYSESKATKEDPEQSVQTEDSWLTNPSYTVQTQKIVDLTQPDDELPSTSTNELIQVERKIKKDKKHKKSKKRKKEDHRNEVKSILVPPNLEYYIDSQPLKAYLTINTLTKPGCPRYKRSEAFRFRTYEYLPRPNYKRYFKATKRLMELDKKPLLDNVDSVEENFQKHLKSNPKDVSEWIKFIEFKDTAMKYTLDLYQKEKQKLEIAEKSMRFNPESESLLKIYLQQLPKVYPTDEVLEIIEKMINKDPNNYLIWNALIYNKQSAMAQCIVPDILKLYEKCMSALFSAVKNDQILVKIFKNCAIFMRQSGLWEQFFALIHLALNLNVSTTAFSNSTKYYSPEHNNTLIEYEELILKSGLPLNEIWLRIEKLRSAYNFLPCVADGVTSDPQRTVLNEDVCHFIYPLMNQNYSFDLFIMILKLLKYPLHSSLLQNSSFFTPEIYEYDSVEDILMTFLEPKRDATMDKILFDFIKEMNVPPSYINTNLAYESYLELIEEILLAGATCFSRKQNLILFQLFLQLERIIVVLEKLSNKGTLSKDVKKKVKSKIKNAIKKLNYQSNLLVYNEYAWIEYELEGFEAAQSVFIATVTQNFIDSNDFTCICLSYIELLMIENKHEKAVEVLTGLALGKVSFEPEVNQVQSTKKLIAMQKQEELVQNLLEVESNSDIFETEDYFSQSRLLLSIKTKIYYLAEIKGVTDAVLEIQKIIDTFQEMNEKHKFIREKLYEIAAFLWNVFQNADRNLTKLIEVGVQEFPHNVHLLRVLSTNLNISWMHLRSVVSKNFTTNVLICLIATCRYRCAFYHFKYLQDSNNILRLYSSDIDISEDAFKQRVINVLRDATNKNSSIRQNALTWRLFLRALFDINSNSTLVKCKNTLYEALDVCPWSKALYLDGAFFSPQELSSLMDLVIEKQLRIHAIPEELEILRSE